MIGSGGVKPLVRQVADSRRKSESEDRADGEHMVRKAAGIDIVLTDLPSGVILQQTVENIRCLVSGRGNDLGRIGAY